MFPPVENVYTITYNISFFHLHAVPMETETIQKLSYVPVCAPHKEYLPWAKKMNYLRNTLPMETDTTQKLSFAPPGKFIEEQGSIVCDCNNIKENIITTIIDSYPKAAVY